MLGFFRRALFQLTCIIHEDFGKSSKALNPRKPWQEVHLAIWLKNSLFFEMSSQSGFCQLVNNAG